MGCEGKSSRVGRLPWLRRRMRMSCSVVPSIGGV